jgi:hypothetical protein
VRYSRLLWDFVLALLTLFAYRIGRALRKAPILLTQSCSSPWPSKGFACSEMLLFMLLLFLLSSWSSGDSLLPEQFHLCFRAFA